MASGLIIFKIGCFDCYLIMLGHKFQLFCQNATCKKISLEICLCKIVLLQISSPALLSGIIIFKKTEIYTTYMLWSLHNSFNFASNMVFFNFMVFKCFLCLKNFLTNSMGKPDLYWDASTQVSLLLELEKIIKNVDSVSLFSNCLLFKSLNLLLNKFPWPRDALRHIRLKLT